MSATQPVRKADSYSSLVEAGMLRYASDDHTTVSVPGVRPISSEAAHAAQRSEELDNSHIKRVPLVLLAGSLGLMVTTWLSDGRDTPAAYSAYLAIFLAMTVTTIRSMSRTEKAAGYVRELDQARSVDVPASTAAAYRRILSAADEIENGNHDAETIASARLAAEGAPHLLSLISDRLSEGTLHTPVARHLADELYRLASEMDAYLVMHRVREFEVAPYEIAAVDVLANTAALSFRDRSANDTSHLKE